MSDPLDDGNYPVQGMVVLRGPPNLDLAKVNRIVNELRLATFPAILLKFFSTDEDVIGQILLRFEFLIIGYRSSKFLDFCFSFLDLTRRMKFVYCS